jgi:hypothetical protein
MDAEHVLRFRLARSGLAQREARTLADAAACPASDFSRDAALFALAARHRDVTRERYQEAVSGGELVVAHIVRGAIHALAPGDHALYGRALISTDDDELGVQLGRQVQRLAADKGFSPTGALGEVAAATRAALHGGRSLSKDELHEELRGRVGADLMPWCKGCKSHHVAPMLWRYGTVQAGAQLDAERRYVLGKPGRKPAAAEAVKRYLRFYGPADSGGFADWAGVARPHAERLWKQVESDLTEVTLGRRRLWALNEDLGELESPPDAEGVRFIPPGDPYLQKPNRSLLVPVRRAPQAAVPPGRESWGGARERAARRSLAGQGSGEADRDRSREARAPGAQGHRARGAPRRRPARRRGSEAGGQLSGRQAPAGWG